MSGESAAQTLLQLRISTLKKKGADDLSKEEKDKLLEEIRVQYARRMSPYYAGCPNVGGRDYRSALYSIDPLRGHRDSEPCTH